MLKQHESVGFTEDEKQKLCDETRSVKFFEIICAECGPLVLKGDHNDRIVHLNEWGTKRDKMLNTFLVSHKASKGFKNMVTIIA